MPHQFAWKAIRIAAMRPAFRGRFRRDSGRLPMRVLALRPDVLCFDATHKARPVPAAPPQLAQRRAPTPHRCQARCLNEKSPASFAARFFKCETFSSGNARVPSSKIIGVSSSFKSAAKSAKFTGILGLSVMGECHVKSWDKRKPVFVSAPLLTLTPDPSPNSRRGGPDFDADSRFSIFHQIVSFCSPLLLWGEGRG